MQGRCETVKENWQRLCGRIEEVKQKNGITYDIEVCAATKTVPAGIVNYAAGLGLRRIGENRVSELLEKYDELDFGRLTADFIGTLQTNKINKLIGRVSLIQSLDSIRAACEIDRVSRSKDCVTDVLVEINSGREQNKSGIMPEAAEEFFDKIIQYKNINVKGIMTIGPACEKKEDIRKYFIETYQIFIDIYQKKLHNIDTPVLSMGMSSDYDIAIECGANMIRPGSALFGVRPSPISQQ
jgi:pyridoxal phosphate enzyme (YggS family)